MEEGGWVPGTSQLITWYGLELSKNQKQSNHSRRPIITGSDSSMNRSEFVAITGNLLKDAKWRDTKRGTCKSREAKLSRNFFLVCHDSSRDVDVSCATFFRERHLHSKGQSIFFESARGEEMRRSLHLSRISTTSTRRVRSIHCMTRTLANFSLPNASRFSSRLHAFRFLYQMERQSEKLTKTIWQF